MRKTIFIGIVLILLVSACTVVETPIPSLTPTTELATSLPPTVENISEVTSTPTTETTTPPLPNRVLPTIEVITPAHPPQVFETPLDEITSFADFPSNQAKGDTPPDFTARLLGGGTFALSDQKDSYHLILPTVIGCGDCLYSLNLLTQAYPPFRGSNIQVLVLDIYQPDEPEAWEFYANYFAEPDFLWAVVDSDEFVMDYDLYGLGTFLLVDPQGKLVYRSDNPVPVDQLTHMFSLANQQGAE